MPDLCRQRGAEAHARPPRDLLSSASSMGPAFRQWLGTGPGRCRGGCGVMMTGLAGRGQAVRAFANGMGPPGAVFSVGRPWGCRGFCRDRKGVPEAERSEPLWSWQVLWLAVLPGREDGPLAAIF